MKMSELTEKDYPTFTQMYKNLPERSSIKAPKTEENTTELVEG